MFCGYFLGGSFFFCCLRRYGCYEQKASENLYKLVHGIAVTQNNNYVEMLRALVENPTASCIEINIEDKNNLSSLVASLILRHC